jgi:two-component system invasion response regulator UvrY
MLEILIVDDHAVVREGLKRIIDDQPGMRVVAEAGCAAQAMRELRVRPFDVAIVDMNLPGRDGMQLLADIRRQWPDLRVLILSFYGEEIYALRALQSGADGYVTKDSGARQLLAAIASVAAGKKFMTPSVAQQLAATSPDQPLHTLLSAREYEVMRLLAAGHAVSEIGKRLDLSVKTVSTYRVRTLEKLNLQTTAQLMRYALEHGLLG